MQQIEFETNNINLYQKYTTKFENLQLKSLLNTSFDSHQMFGKDFATIDKYQLNELIKTKIQQLKAVLIEMPNVLKAAFENFMQEDIAEEFQETEDNFYLIRESLCSGSDYIKRMGLKHLTGILIGFNKIKENINQFNEEQMSKLAAVIVQQIENILCPEGTAERLQVIRNSIEMLQYEDHITNKLYENKVRILRDISLRTVKDAINSKYHLLHKCYFKEYPGSSYIENNDIEYDQENLLVIPLTNCLTYEMETHIASSILNIFAAKYSIPLVEQNANIYSFLEDDNFKNLCLYVETLFLKQFPASIASEISSEIIAYCSDKVQKHNDDTWQVMEDRFSEITSFLEKESIKYFGDIGKEALFRSLLSITDEYLVFMQNPKRIDLIIENLVIEYMQKMEYMDFALAPYNIIHNNWVLFIKTLDNYNHFNHTVLYNLNAMNFDDYSVEKAGSSNIYQLFKGLDSNIIQLLHDCASKTKDFTPEILFSMVSEHIPKIIQTTINDDYSHKDELIEHYTNVFFSESLHSENSILYADTYFYFCNQFNCTMNNLLSINIYALITLKKVIEKDPINKSLCLIKGIEYNLFTIKSLAEVESAEDIKEPLIHILLTKHAIDCCIKSIEYPDSYPNFSQLCNLDIYNLHLVVSHKALFLYELHSENPEHFPNYIQLNALYYTEMLEISLSKNAIRCFIESINHPECFPSFREAFKKKGLLQDSTTMCSLIAKTFSDNAVQCYKAKKYYPDFFPNFDDLYKLSQVKDQFFYDDECIKIFTSNDAINFYILSAKTEGCAPSFKTLQQLHADLAETLIYNKDNIDYEEGAKKNKKFPSIQEIEHLSIPKAIELIKIFMLSSEKKSFHEVLLDSWKHDVKEIFHPTNSMEPIQSKLAIMENKFIGLKNLIKNYTKINIIKSSIIADSDLPEIINKKIQNCILYSKLNMQDNFKSELNSLFWDLQNAFPPKKQSQFSMLMKLTSSKENQMQL